MGLGGLRRSIETRDNDNDRMPDDQCKERNPNKNNKLGTNRIMEKDMCSSAILSLRESMKTPNAEGVYGIGALISRRFGG